MTEFFQQDAIEKDMGGKVTQFTPDQLVCYVRDSMYAENGITMAVDGFRERAIFKSMQRIYGPVDAGRIIKWVFFRHRGKWDGDPIRFASFAKGRKWWVDLMHTEMQQYEQDSNHEQARNEGPTTASNFVF